jgi:hypothetical protein
MSHGIAPPGLSRHRELLKLHWILRKGEFRRVRTMPEHNSQISQSILSLLEGETIRVILRDGTVFEGSVRSVTREELFLEDKAISLDQIATYYVLKGT